MSVLVRHLKLILAATALLLGACNRESEQQEQTKQSLQSRIRTLDLAQQQRAGARVPDGFIRQISAAAEKALTRAQQTDSGHADAEARELELKISDAQSQAR